MGLLDAEGGGWPSSLNPRQQKRLEADLRKPPSALGVSASAIFKSMDLDMLSGFLLG